jgi:gamma-glutamylcyclotransferase (GGCT)/AIG2-like uncharacterized protein YtfP
MSTDPLFVYGSLKRAGRHHDELGDAPFLGETRTAEGFGLSTVGEYLALVERPGSAESVVGELYRVSSQLLLRLDDFEGPGYRRGLVPVMRAQDREHAPESGFALAYLLRSR